MNVANLITEAALSYPHKRSIVFPTGRDGNGTVLYKHLTFIQLEKKINQYANAFKKNGVVKGDRCLLFVKPGLEFSPVVFALFKLGAIPVMIDPGMGRKNLLNAVLQVRPNVLIGIKIIHLLKVIYKKYFRGIKKSFVIGKIPFLAKPLDKIATDEPFIFDTVECDRQDGAAILFTSGGTGMPKGVVYTHEIFINQTKMLQEEFNLTHEDTDIPGFPLFSLFTLSMGMTSCIPDMNPSKPSKANPKKLVQNILDQGATFVAGSPAIWKNVAEYCLENRLTLPSVKYLVMFGAPIPIKMHENFKKILPNGTTYTPYGATECLPISNISGREILQNFKEKMNNGKGTCIGKAFPGVEYKIIKSTQSPIVHIDAIDELAPNDIGEIIVCSKTVTPGYFEMREKTELAKIVGDPKGLWHRMGDVGYVDETGTLWFCGRKSHVVTTKEQSDIFPIPVESIFNQHPDVGRSALIEVWDKNIKQVGIVIERNDHKIKLKKVDQDRFFEDLLNIAGNNPQSKRVEHVFLHKSFPVDVRHNIKIDRLALSKWANELRNQT